MAWAEGGGLFMNCRSDPRLTPDAQRRRSRVRPQRDAHRKAAGRTNVKGGRVMFLMQLCLMEGGQKNIVDSLKDAEKTVQIH